MKVYEDREGRWWIGPTSACSDALAVCTGMRVSLYDSSTDQYASRWFYSPKESLAKAWVYWRTRT